MGDLRDEMAKFAMAHNLPIKDATPQIKKKRTLTTSEKHEGDDKVPKRVLPLYKDFKDFPEFKPDDISPIKPKETSNTGLLFDKFCDHWSGQEQIDSRKKRAIPEEITNDPTWDANPKTWFLKSIIKQHNEHTKTAILLDSYHSRRSALITALNGEICSFKTLWRFVSGLGMGHVLETGFVWHRTLGVPYLPGSSVKGLIRAYTDPEKGWSSDKKKWDADYKRLFGDSKDMGAGSLVIFDAIPETKPTLELDIMNPHYASYYEDKTGTVSPADYHSPRPIFFLTVKSDTPFKFALAPRPGRGTADDLTKGYELLREALSNIGAGAKTAVGYGYFK
jgi:CRISPR-associated protein Cmr6